MSGPNEDDDLQLEPMHKGRASTIVIAVVLLAAGAAVAFFVNSRFRKTRSADAEVRAGTAWSQLRRCLVGDQLQGREHPSTLIRRIEITLPGGQRDLPEDERLHRYPYRCATYASLLTHALFEERSDDPSHQLFNQVASRAASALEQGALRTGANDPSAYLDELFATADLAHLPPGNAGNVPLPPPAGHPLTMQQMDALTAGAGTGLFVSTDMPASNSVRVVLGQTQRSLCVFAGTPDPATTLTHVHCARIGSFANAPAHVEPIAGDDGTLAYVRLANGPTPGDAYIAEASVAPFIRSSVGAWSGSGSVFETFVAPTTPAPATNAPAPAAASQASGPATAPTWTFERVRGGASPVIVPITFPSDESHRSAPIALGDLALVATRSDSAAATEGRAATVDAGAASDASVASNAADAASAPAASPDGGAPAGSSGRLLAATIASTDPPSLSFAPVADVTAPEREQTLSVCRAGSQLAVAVHGAWHRTSVVFFRDGHWSTPVDGIAHPGSFTCRNDEATFTWMETGTRRRIHQLRCTPSRCAAAEAIPPVFEGDVLPVVTDLDGQVLLLATPGPGHGLQMVRAPIDHLAGTDPVVLLDDGQHGGLEIAPNLSVIARTGVAVVLINAATDPYTSYSIRIDSSGAFRSPQQD